MPLRQESEKLRVLGCQNGLFLTKIGLTVTQYVHKKVAGI